MALSSSEQYWVSRIRGMFDQFGVPYDYHSSGATEDGNARITRLAKALVAGTLTMTSLQKSLGLLRTSYQNNHGINAPRDEQPRDRQPQNTGPSFLEQARLLFPFIPDELLRIFAEKWEEFGSRDLALQAMRQDPRYDHHFPGIKREDGSLRMTEQEFLSTTESYRRQLGQFGVPVNAVLTSDRLRGLIEGEVSPQEFGQRLNQTYTQLITNIDEVREFFAANFGASGLSDAALFASALDPSQSPLEFQRQIAQAHIGGEAAARGFSGDVDLDEARRLESFGLDQAGARQLFGQAQAQLPRLNELIDRFNDPDDEVTLAEFSDAIVISDPEQLRQFGRLFGQQRSSFSPRGGVSGDRSGALSGLLER